MSLFERWFGFPGAAREATPPRGDPARLAEVEAVLEELRPMLRADGGDISLLAVEEGVVVVRLKGACASCSASAQSLYQAIEPRLKARLAWVTDLQNET